MTLAWYAAYGSNTDETRFGEYVARCTQPAAPADDRAHVIDLALVFAREGTTRWGPGGVAFVVLRRDPTPETLVRLWLLPVATIAEIGAMENGLPRSAGRLDLDEVVEHGSVIAHRGWYDSWAHCGEVEGRPVVTLASTADLEPNPPGQAYAEVVARGLRATHGLTAAEVAAYLAPRTGLRDSLLMEWQKAGGGYPGAE